VCSYGDRVRLTRDGGAIKRRTGLGGAFGPAGFIGAWVAGGAIKESYSPVRDAISRLAAVGASTRPLMSAGFVAFGVGVPIYASALRSQLAGPAWIAAAIAGVSTIGVALAPLDRSSTGDTVHAVFAGVGYVGIAATALLSARQLAKIGAINWARLGLVTGSVSAVCLLLSTTNTANGLFQRVGLTSGDVFLAASGLAMATGRFPANVAAKG
jgi:Protein of unknown function (DUF998)